MQNHTMDNKMLIVMFISSMIAGFITGMNLFVNNKDDIRLNINDFYMGLVMTGMMFLFMGIFYKSKKLILIGFITSIIFFIILRKQLFVNKNGYLRSMIPHHSMAIMMTKKLIEKEEDLTEEMKNLTNNIIQTQEEEIKIMKNL